MTTYRYKVDGHEHGDYSSLDKALEALERDEPGSVGAIVYELGEAPISSEAVHRLHAFREPGARLERYTDRSGILAWWARLPKDVRDALTEDPNRDLTSQEAVAVTNTPPRRQGVAMAAFEGQDYDGPKLAGDTQRVIRAITNR